MDFTIIQPASIKDLQTITDFNQAMALETEDKQLDADTLAKGVRAILEDSNKGRYYMARVNGKAAGQMLITREYSDWRDGWFWWIQSVYVAPEHRRKGLYTSLYRHVYSIAAKEQDVCGLRLYVDKDNAKAQQTYSALGMELARYDMFEVEF